MNNRFLVKKNLENIFENEKGWSLVFVLMMLITFSSIALQTLTHSIFAVQHSKTLVEYIKKFQKTEEKLIQIENEIKNINNNPLDRREINIFDSDSIEKNSLKITEQSYEFVPDHLEWECKQGIIIYKIKNDPLSSFYAHRFE